MKKNSTLAYIVTIMMVFTLLAPVVIAPPVQAEGIPDIVQQMNEIIPYLDQADKDAIQAARETLQGIPLNDTQWDTVLGVGTTNNLLTPQVIAQFDGDDEAAKTALINVAIGLGNIYYSQNTTTLGTNLTNFKEANKATFQKLFGTETTVDELYQLLQATRGQFAAVISTNSTYLDTLAFGSNENLVQTIPNVLNDAMQNVLNTDPTFNEFRGKLEAIGWSTTKLINQQNELGTIIDSSQAARLGLAKAMVRSESELYYDNNGTRVAIPKDATTKQIAVSLQAGDVVVYAVRIMGQEVATTLLEWGSSNTSAASVAYGDGTTYINGYPVVTANQAGTTTITAYRYDETTFPEGSAANDWVLKFDVTVSSSGTTIDGYIDLLARPADGNAGVTVALKTTAYSATTDADGHFTLTGIPAGTYILVVSTPGYLTREIGNVVVAATPIQISTAITPIELMAGDTNNDTLINLTDLQAILTSYNSVGAAAAIDFNGDGLINLSDLQVVLTNYNKTSATYSIWSW